MIAKPDASDSASFTVSDAPETALTQPRKVGSVLFNALVPLLAR